ncbi:hypothetical protein GCM10010442_77110 [Kitasatospora kifunensis]|uniref:Competence protein ComEC n=1 Tax=Kitasatospora kifunensis TaxID=58351 RepID=A0A7W7R0G0_KITKI|nr:competence protein ComEC [Kitasatospora kifunensis]
MPQPPGAADRSAAAPPPGLDLRLLLPTIAAWCVTALLLGVGAQAAPALLTGAGLAAGCGALLLVTTRHRHHRDHHHDQACDQYSHQHRRQHRDHRRRPHSPAVMTAAVLLTCAAATTCTVLHTADLHRGPLPALATAVADAKAVDGQPGTGQGPPVARTSVSVDLTVTGDPRSRTSRARGSNPGRPVLTVDATADQVTTPAGTTRTRTPVTVIVQERDTAAWQGLLPSARIAAEARVLPASRPEQDTGAVLLAQGPPRVLTAANWAQRLAGRLRAGLRQACAGLSPDARALLPGLVIGDTSAMPDDLDEAFHVTDLVHLTAVSGANLSIVLAVLLGAPARAGTAERGGLAAFLGLPLRLSALLGAVLTVAFVTLCRPDPSVLRAAATGLLGLLALALGRPRQAVPALAGAVLVLLLVDPFLARSYGFLLSALATLGLLTAGRRWAKALHERGWPHHLADGIAAAAAAQAFCAPATVLLAPRVSLVGIPCNLLAELAITPATLIGFATLVAAPISAGLARILAELAALPTEWLAAVARYGASLPGAELAWTPGWLGVLTLALTVLAACYAAPLLVPDKSGSDRSGLDRTRPDRSKPDEGADESGLDKSGAAQPGAAQRDPGPDRRVLPGARRRGRAARIARVLVAILLIAGFLVLLLRPTPLVRIATGWPPTGARLVMCSVGQGDLLVLPVPADAAAGAPDTAVVVDTGPDPAAADTCLRDLGITRVALVLLTHFHADHSEGLPGVLRHRSVGAVETTTVDAPEGEVAKVSRWAAEAQVPVLRAAPGEHRSAGPELSWDVLWPTGRLGPETPGANNASVALLVTAGELRFALLGDLEPAAQAELLSRVRPGPVDVLKVAHHGSANQDWELARALHPRLALVSVGANNPYGHPSARTVDHLRALGSTVLRTDRAGDIAVLGDTPATLRVVTHPHPAAESAAEPVGAPVPAPAPAPAPARADPLRSEHLLALPPSSPDPLSRPRASRHGLPPPRRPRPASPAPTPARAPPGPPATARPRRRPRPPTRRGPARTDRGRATVRAGSGPPPRRRRGRRGPAAAGHWPPGGGPGHRGYRCYESSRWPFCLVGPR